MSYPIMDAFFTWDYTSWPANRYRMHIYDSISRAYFLIRFVITHFNVYPKMELVSTDTDRSNIRQMEIEHINKKVEEGCMLLNHECARFDHIKLKYRNIPTEVFESIRFQEEELLMNLKPTIQNA